MLKSIFKRSKKSIASFERGIITDVDCINVVLVAYHSVFANALTIGSPGMAHLTRIRTQGGPMR